MWTPELAVTYGIRPWEMHLVTLREIELIADRERRLVREARKEARRRG